MSNSISNGCIATFTTNFIPPKPDLRGSYEIPLGFIISPLAPQSDNYDDDATVRVVTNNPYLTEQDMILCTTCLSYLNLYSNFDDQTGKWICPICKCENMSTKTHTSSSTPIMYSNIMNSQIVEYHQIAAGYDNSTSASRASRYSYNQTPSDELSIVGSNVTIIILDGNLSPNEVTSIMSNLSSLFSNDKTQMIGLIIYTSFVNVYQIGIQGVASADIYSIDDDDGDEFEGDEFDDSNSGNVLELEDDRMYLGLGSWDQIQFCASAYFGLDVSKEVNGRSNLNISQENQQSKYTSDNNTKNNLTSSRRDMLRQKREARMKNETKMNNFYYDLDECTPEQSAEFFKQLQNKKKVKAKRRCTGEAVAYGLSLALSVEERSSARLLIFTNGCPNFGKGNMTQRISNNTLQEGDMIENKEHMEKASLYFDSIGKESVDNGVAIDVFCGDNNTALIGSQVLLSLVRPSAGYLLSYSSFIEDRFKSDLEYILNSTRMSWSKNQDIDSVRLGMACPNWMNVINGCLIDLRMPR